MLKLKQFEKSVILENMVFHNSVYAIQQGYTKTLLKAYIEKAYNYYIKKDLRFSMSTGTMRDNDGHLSSYSNVNDWKNATPEDKDPLYEFAHQVKCEAVRLYNCDRYHL